MIQMLRIHKDPIWTQNCTEQLKRKFAKGLISFPSVILFLPMRKVKQCNYWSFCFLFNDFSIQACYPIFSFFFSFSDIFSSFFSLSLKRRKTSQGRKLKERKKRIEMKRFIFVVVYFFFLVHRHHQHSHHQRESRLILALLN